MMKRLFFCLWFFVFVCSAKNYEEIFLQANSLYEQGKFKQALEFYESIGDSKGWATWYNMGACYYQEKDYLQALVCWHRAAAHGGSSDLLVMQGLQECYQKLNLEQNSYYDTLLLFINHFSLKSWQLLFLVTLFFVALIFWFIRVKKVLLCMALSIVCLLSGVGLLVKVSSTTQCYALVAQQSPLLVGQDDHFDELASIRPGQKVIVRERNESWAKVEIAKKTGWMRNQYLISI